MMRLFDTHAHYDDQRFEGDRDADCHDDDISGFHTSGSDAERKGI